MSNANKRAVIFTLNGKTRTDVVLLVDGYSTEEDIPQMIALKYGAEAEIVAVQGVADAPA